MYWYAAGKVLRINTARSQEPYCFNKTVLQTVLSSAEGPDWLLVVRKQTVNTKSSAAAKSQLFIYFLGHPELQQPGIAIATDFLADWGCGQLNLLGRHSPRHAPACLPANWIPLWTPETQQLNATAPVMLIMQNCPRHNHVGFWRSVWFGANKWLEQAE